MAIGKTILIIDDDIVLSEALQFSLESDGHEVTCCDDGVTAIALSRGKSFQVIIADYNMPGLNGCEIVSILRKRFANSFIIGYSGGWKEKDFLEAGADYFLKKPFEYPEINSLIKHISV